MQYFTAPEAQPWTFVDTKDTGAGGPETETEAGQARASHGSHLPQTPIRAAFLLQPQLPTH